MKSILCLFRNSRRKGFTLTEVLIYIAILVIAISAITGFVVWSVRSYTKAKVARETLDSARRAMQIMTRETREAISIYAPTTTANQLSLETTNYLPQGEETTYLDFFACNSALCLKKESQDPIALTSDKVEISSLVFELIGAENSSMQIDLTVTYKNPQNRAEYQSSVNLTSTVSLRSD